MIARIWITLLVVLGLAIVVTSASAISAFAAAEATAAQAQYGGMAPPATAPLPRDENEVLGEDEAGGTTPDEAGRAPVRRPRSPARVVDRGEGVQSARQIEAAQTHQLPFTGWLVGPTFVIGIVFVLAGAALRRASLRSRGRSARS